ncbi:MAG: AAA family ATPase, partial [Synergistaceae bacterium]|nr:AAA family ATPase [Synergistaceae bacterium]
VRGALEEAIARECDAASRGRAPDAPDFARARRLLKRIFALGPEALALCEAVYLNQNCRQLETYLEDTLEIWMDMNRNTLAAILGLRQSALAAAARELELCMVLDRGRCNYCRIEDDLLPLWEVRDAREADRLFCVPLKGKTLPLKSFRIPEEDVRHIVGLLSAKSEAPMHILLYGPPGTGKTTFARSLAKELKLDAWSVNSREDDSDHDRRMSLIATLNMAHRHPGSFVLVDEAERLLDTSWHGGSKEKDKAWLNALLEKEGSRVIWATNHVEHIDTAVRRRFSFSVCFDDLGRGERCSLWKEIIASQRATRFFTGEQIHALARDYEVPVAVMEMAVEQAKAMGCGRADFAPAVERSVRAYAALMRDGERRGRRANDASKGFTLEGIALEGPLPDLMDRCRRADAAMRAAKDISDLPPGCATMLFYGPPGTGKTALAQHIAEELDRECLVQRGSDLLDCFVGATEQKIAAAFRRAEKEGAVLLIDEADTFLYPRSSAYRSWEVSAVNEFLTALEECRSFCICTTNRLDGLDEAALRRFSHKAAFTWAEPDQIMALYDLLLAPLCRDELPAKLEGELRAMARLAPGDFHAVRAQYESLFSDAPPATHDTLVAALRDEVSLKERRSGRPAGF